MEHGGDVYTEGIFKGKELLDFSSNINPLGVPESFSKHIEEALECIQRYPDVKYRNLKKYIRDYIEFCKEFFETSSIDKRGSLGVRTYDTINEEDIVLGNGAAEIIDLVISCFSKVCIVVPSFTEYELNASKWECEIEYSYLKEDFTYDYEDIASKVKSVDALIIGNPNNPNGGIVEKHKFKNILDYCEKKHKTIIIDEAFAEFTGKRGFSFLKEAENYKCIFIIRALTKFYAMPGIRMGYGISKNTLLIEKIKDKQNPWNINCFAEVSAKYVLADKEYMERSLKWIEEERRYMLYQLRNIELIERVYMTYSNFILCKIKDINCFRLYDLCLNNGIAIRKCHNFRGLNEYYIRLAIKDRSSNEKIIHILNSNIFVEE